MSILEHGVEPEPEKGEVLGKCIAIVKRNDVYSRNAARFEGIVRRLIGTCFSMLSSFARTLVAS